MGQALKLVEAADESGLLGLKGESEHDRVIPRAVAHRPLVQLLKPFPVVMELYMLIELPHVLFSLGWLHSHALLFQ
ncbi:Uncharacterised protein [Mycobacterium tuberculosis]|nr:Uncharacterised protein [Mycobacterium tuberculosis]